MSSKTHIRNVCKFKVAHGSSRVKRSHLPCKSWLKVVIDWAPDEGSCTLVLCSFVLKPSFDLPLCHSQG